MSLPRFLKRIFANNGDGPKLLGSILPFGSSNPKAHGRASAGTSEEASRADHVHPITPVATQSDNGLLSSTDKTKLDGIQTGAQVNPGVATQSANGLLSSTDKTKLDGIQTGAQVNPGVATQSANGLMSSTDKTKLDGIQTGANKSVNMVGASASTSGSAGLVPAPGAGKQSAVLTGGGSWTSLGTGLEIGSDSKLSVSFTTDQLKAFIAPLGIKLPLTGNKSFYVNGATGSNTLDAGRGESASKPFASINACANYVIENFDLRSYVATINVDPNTTYTESLVLPSFVTTSGYVKIQSSDSTKSFVVQLGNNNAVTVNNGDYTFHNIQIVLNIDYTLPELASARGTRVGIWANENSHVTLEKFRIKLNLTGPVPASSPHIYCVYAQNNSHITITPFLCASPDTDYSQIEVVRNNDNNSAITAFIAGSEGKISFTGVNSDAYSNRLNLRGPLYVAGGNRGSVPITGTVAVAAGGIVQSMPSYSRYITFINNGGFAGRPYAATSGGKISVGANYFPGSVEPYVEESTYSWCTAQ